MKVLSILFLTFFFSALTYGQEAPRTAKVFGSISIEESVWEDPPKQEPPKKTVPASTKKKKPAKTLRLIKFPGIIDLNPKPKLIQRPLKGAYVLFTDEKGTGFRAIAGENGKYEIKLPYGKYQVFSTASLGCWMCAEYYKNDLVIDHPEDINLVILLPYAAIIED